VTEDSGFSFTKGVAALHAKGAFGHFLIKKHWCWSAKVPGNQIDAYMMTKKLGEMVTFVQDLKGLPFYVHCTCDADYVTNIMLTHRILEERDETTQPDGA
jgi:hypothetical protein